MNIYREQNINNIIDYNRVEYKQDDLKSINKIKRVECRVE